MKRYYENYASEDVAVAALSKYARYGIAYHVSQSALKHGSAY